MKDLAADRDRLILSKGHAAAALYTTLFKFGLMSEKDLDTYNLNDSLLSAYVNHLVSCVEHSTDALGHRIAGSFRNSQRGSHHARGKGFIR
ncbi:MAG: hypothetical protein HQL12_01955 [Candidatus Omnitrophica bacterium]|nr:hypothetical protein [Candidatus Omnitrophota bacterium]